jgi:hypothetical protein
MKKEILTGNVEEQYVCPDCGKASDYKDIGKYRRGLPAELMGMDFREFIKQKTGIYHDSKKGMGNVRLAGLCNILYEGRLYKEYVNLPNNKYTTQWHEKKIGKVKDLYSLTEKEIWAVRNVGKLTWGRLNEVLDNNNLAPLKLPYGYTVNYPLKKNKK